MSAKSREVILKNNNCCCCLSEGCYKDINSEYIWMNEREIYSELLKNVFNISVSITKVKS